MQQQSPSQRLEELIRERARLDIELERCRELVTVLFVDIAGSTRFYDEHGDVAGLVMVQKCLDLLIPTVEAHDGVVIKTIGDAILARFCDAEAAVRSAIEMQRNLAERNVDRVPDDQIHVRVGINLGLALLKGADVFGDVVNVAARIEAAVGPDEIAISPSVYEKIRHLPDVPVRRKASGVQLRGKAEKLDLYSVVWKPDDMPEPAPPVPSKEQLFIATGLHRTAAELARNGNLGAAAVSGQRTAGLDETAILGAQDTERSPETGVRFAIICLGADGTPGQRYWLDHPGMIAGQKGEIALGGDPLIAAQHARFTQLGEGVYVEDMGAAEGAFLRLREPHRLKDGDLIQLGRLKLRYTSHVTEHSLNTNHVSADETLVLNQSASSRTKAACLARLNSQGEETERYPLSGPETSFGRSKGTHIFPEDPYLSSSHARVKLQNGEYFLEDLGSTNGTFARIRKRALARDGDTLMLGSQLLRIARA
jgi:class 3 adenylate cyclase/pSer/pThr/pTyr-binding forkhead associated (FHA) protein